MRGETKDDKNKVTDEKAEKTEEGKTEETDAAGAGSSQKAEEESSHAKATEAGAAEAASKAARAAEATTISGNTYGRNIRQAAKDNPADAQIAKAKEIRHASRKTRVEAELTPEAQKVRRSRARNAYAQNMQSNEIAIAVDVKR